MVCCSTCGCCGHCCRFFPKMTPLEAIKTFCRQECFYKQPRQRCDNRDCPLFEFRNGRDPYSGGHNAKNHSEHCSRNEPRTISSRETISRSELRLSVVNRGGRRMVDLRIWDIGPDGDAVPHRNGYTITMDEASVLRDSITHILERES